MYLIGNTIRSGFGRRTGVLILSIGVAKAVGGVRSVLRSSRVPRTSAIVSARRSAAAAAMAISELTAAKQA